MTAQIKTTAIPAAGYVYQTMQGVNLLCDWLEAPTRYSRVRFECDEDAIAPQGLDDLVAERSDGRVDLWQVKFTPNDESYRLDWNWLLDKPGKTGGRSRCNLRKWFDAFSKIPEDRIGDICLITNRMPDSGMEACLRGSFIDYTKAPDTIPQLVEKELGSAENAQRFFRVLQVKHSDKGFDQIDAHVTARLRRHGNIEGVETLLNRVVRWSIERNLPTPGGWITLDIIHATLKAAAPEPLPENFVIPAGYRVPDAVFHRDFIAIIEATPRQPIVLTGPPGRGKSTYLSKVCEVLQKKQIPFVRHHYYLSATDRTFDRMTSFAVQESLLAQIERFHGDIVCPDTGLGSALHECATHYKAQGKPFVVFLDGLDHVWRTYGHDKRPLDEIFNQVLPCTDNLVLVVGTQPVDDAELPFRLLAEAPRNTWHELPAMSGDAVVAYLRKEIRTNRLRIDVSIPVDESVLLEAAEALRERTNGHPLHVIYATEELIRSGHSLSKWSIEQLSGDLSRDVKSYYGSLWHRLAHSQRDVLRLVCSFDFFWPEGAFRELARLAGTAEPEVTAVMHLMHRSAAGLKAFHESLIVFVRQTEDFEQRANDLAPYVESWLSNSAPGALRVNWLWAVQARLGNPENLFSGLKRDWVLDRLQEGYPTELFEGLLADAEERALLLARYADAYRLRHLKYRLLNSLSYQLIGVDAARLKICTWKLAPDDSVIAEAIASRHENSTVEVAALGTALLWRGDTVNAEVCGDESYRRYLGESRFANIRHGVAANEELKFLVESFSKLRVIGTTQKSATRIIEDNPIPIGESFLVGLVASQDLGALIKLVVDLPEGASKAMVANAAVRVAALLGADLTAWGEFSLFAGSALAGCLAAIAKLDLPLRPMELDTDWLAGGYEERRESLAVLAHEWFFGAARLEFDAGGGFMLLPAPAYKARTNVTDYLNSLGEVGREFACSWRDGKPIRFIDLFKAFEKIDFPSHRQSYDVGQGARDFRCALLAIAMDCHLLSVALGQPPLIDREQLQAAMECTWFDPGAFRTQYAANAAKALTRQAAEYFISHQLAALENDSNQETGVRMRVCLELCEIALEHGLDTVARTLCLMTWDLALGYGQRKDPALPEVMDAIEHLAEIAPDAARRLLAEVSPQVHGILQYTDGKGTRHVLRQADHLLARLHRGALVEKYREHTDAGDWSAAEDSLDCFFGAGASVSEVTEAVLRTGVHAAVHDTLQNAAINGSQEASRLLAVAEQHIGVDAGLLRRHDYTTPSEADKPFSGQVSSYGISQIDSLLADLREHYMIRGDVLREWYAYWEGQGKGSDLLAQLEPRLLSETCRDDDLHSLLDAAFETKRRLMGAAAAFSLIVQAQLLNGGWLRYYFEASEKTAARLRLVARYYPKRCDEFVAKSAISWLSNPKDSRIIPGELMVFFLGLQGRTDEATRFAEEMVRCVQDDTRTLPLTTPLWSKKLLAAPEASPADSELELLVTRLRWPVASTRWWAMQELSQLLRNPNFGEMVSGRLVKELRAARLEAEVVELLTIFWMATMRGLSPPSELGDAVSYPSILASLLLDGMGRKAVHSANPPLQTAPAEFDVPSLFLEIQRREVPRIYLAQLERLESHSGCPFVHQCGFEWSLNQNAYPDAPLQGDLHYFVRAFGDGMTGAFPSRATLRILSAFQRTLATAQQKWRAPTNVMQHFALDALPIEPTLAFLRPTRPSWLPPFGQYVGTDGASVETYIRQTIQALEAAPEGVTLLALSTPVFVSQNEFVALSVVRWRQWDAIAVHSKQLAVGFHADVRTGKYGRSKATGLDTRTELTVLPLEKIKDTASMAAPLAAIYNFDRLGGYLQRDLYPTRIYYPVVTGNHGKVVVAPMDGRLSVTSDLGDLATIYYWNAGWAPTHPQPMGALCGTALVGAIDSLQTMDEPAPIRHFYHWQLKRFTKSAGYEPFAEAEFSGAFMA